MVGWYCKEIRVVGWYCKEIRWYCKEIRECFVPITTIFLLSQHYNVYVLDS